MSNVQKSNRDLAFDNARFNGGFTYSGIGNYGVNAIDAFSGARIGGSDYYQAFRSPGWLALECGANVLLAGAAFADARYKTEQNMGKLANITDPDQRQRKEAELNASMVGSSGGHIAAYSLLSLWLSRFKRFPVSVSNLGAYGASMLGMGAAYYAFRDKSKLTNEQLQDEVQLAAMGSSTFSFAATAVAWNQRAAAKSTLSKLESNIDKWHAGQLTGGVPESYTDRAAKNTLLGRFRNLPLSWNKQYRNEARCVADWIKNGDINPRAINPTAIGLIPREHRFAVLEALKNGVIPDLSPANVERVVGKFEPVAFWSLAERDKNFLLREIGDDSISWQQVFAHLRTGPILGKFNLFGQKIGLTGKVMLACLFAAGLKAYTKSRRNNEDVGSALVSVGSAVLGGTFLAVSSAQVQTAAAQHNWFINNATKQKLIRYRLGYEAGSKYDKKVALLLSERSYRLSQQGFASWNSSSVQQGAKNFLHKCARFTGTNATRWMRSSPAFQGSLGVTLAAIGVNFIVEWGLRSVFKPQK